MSHKAQFSQALDSVLVLKIHFNVLVRQVPGSLSYSENKNSLSWDVKSLVRKNEMEIAAFAI